MSKNKKPNNTSALPAPEFRPFQSQMENIMAARGIKNAHHLRKAHSRTATAKNPILSESEKDIVEIDASTINKRSLAKYTEFTKSSAKNYKYQRICANALAKIRTIPLPIIPELSDSEVIFICQHNTPSDHMETLIRNNILLLNAAVTVADEDNATAAAAAWAYTVVCYPGGLDACDEIERIQHICSTISPQIRVTVAPTGGAKSREFWEQFHGEVLLVHYENGAILSPNGDGILTECLRAGYSYVGEPFIYDNVCPPNNIGMGCVSLRIRSAILRVFDDLAAVAISTTPNEPEDVFYSRLLGGGGDRSRVTTEHALAFCSDVSGFGCRLHAKTFARLEEHLALITGKYAVAALPAKTPRLLRNLFDELPEIIKTWMCENVEHRILIDKLESSPTWHKSGIVTSKFYTPIIHIPFSNVSTKKPLKIPKIIHKVFVNDTLENLPKEIQRKAIASWSKMYPDYKLIIHDKQTIKEYLLEHYGKCFLQLYNKLIPYAFKADFFRYCVLYKDGGVYSDLKQVIYEKIDFESYSFVGAYEKHLPWETIIPSIDFVPCQNCLLGCTPGHPYIKGIIDMCIQNIWFEQYGCFSTDITGPMALGRVIKYIRRSIPRSNILPEQFYYFFEYTIQESSGSYKQFFINAENSIESRHIIKHKYDNSPGGIWNQFSFTNNDYAQLWGSCSVFHSNNLNPYFIQCGLGICKLPCSEVQYLLTYLKNYVLIADATTPIEDILGQFIDNIVFIHIKHTELSANSFTIVLGNMYYCDDFSANSIEECIAVIRRLCGAECLLITDSKTITATHVCQSFHLRNNTAILRDVVNSRPQIVSSRFAWKHKIQPYFIYFPQYHTFSENNSNFYFGYSDYKNLLHLNEDLKSSHDPENKIITSAYKLCETPQLSEGICEYDLLKHQEIIQQQMNIISDYGVPGFAMYYYWFSTNNVSGNQTMLMRNIIDQFFPSHTNKIKTNMRGKKVFFIWANENWTGHICLSSANSGTKIENEYNAETFKANASNLIAYFKHENYLKIKGKPVFFMYHAFKLTKSLIVEFKNILDRVCISAGFKGVYLGLNTIFHEYPTLTLSNGYVPFYINLNYKNDAKTKKHFLQVSEQTVIDYNAYVSSGEHVSSRNINTLFFNFDNRARMCKPNKLSHAVYCVNNTIINKIMFMRQFENAYGETADERTENDDVRNIMLINAWNEWGESMTFEPSVEYGCCNLNLLKEQLGTIQEG